MNKMPEKLSNWWKRDEAPQRDVAFKFAVMAKIERRRLWKESGLVIGIALLVGLVAWTLAPAVEPIIQNPDPLLVVTVVFGLLAAWVAESGMMDR